MNTSSSLILYLPSQVHVVTIIHLFHHQTFPQKVFSLKYQLEDQLESCDDANMVVAGIATSRCKAALLYSRRLQF